MKVSVWYNLNHHFYFTNYRQTYSNNYKVGDINKFNHQLIYEKEFYNPKLRLKEQTADYLERLANRIRYGKIHNKRIVSHNVYPWWYKK